MLKGKLKFIVAILIIAGALSYLVFAGVKDTMVYYLTISELEAKTPSVYGDRVRVSGTVVPGTIVKDKNGNIKFSITDGENSINVSYAGIVPDIFKDDVEAVVEGKYSRNNEFKADVLLAKCPTKYESDEQLYDLKKENS
ncbi:MAG: cytochrome c maturation protein CcmE [Thermodesulfobacteriota bacterium]